jgi:hypothetical protein
MTEYVERKVGTHLDAGDELMRLADTSTVVAVMMVPEKEMGDVRKGLPVRIQLASFPTRFFRRRSGLHSGAMRTPVKASRSDGSFLTFQIRMESLKPELTGFAKIYCGPRRIIEVMTRRIGLWIRHGNLGAAALRHSLG